MTEGRCFCGRLTVAEKFLQSPQKLCSIRQQMLVFGQFYWTCLKLHVVCGGGNFHPVSHVNSRQLQFFFFPSDLKFDKVVVLNVLINSQRFTDVSIYSEWRTIFSQCRTHSAHRHFSSLQEAPMWRNWKETFGFMFSVLITKLWVTLSYEHYHLKYYRLQISCVVCKCHCQFIILVYKCNYL